MVAVQLKGLKSDTRLTYIDVGTYELLEKRRIDRGAALSDYVFVHKHNRPFTADSMQHRVSRYMDKHGLGTMTHDLRVSKVTEWYKHSENNIKMTSSLVGHRSIVTTQKYVDCTPDQKKAVIEKAASCAPKRKRL